ncbi:MAG: protein kinase [Xanthomonadales bacterium]|nr:protein kinase [Xanthomonadales bacterium]
MIVDDEQLLLKLSEQIAAGETIDWGQTQGLSPTLCEQLRQIELLAGGFVGDPTQPATDSAELMLGIGERFGPLVVRSLLGSGSFGRVYRAYDAELDREVALKLVNAHRRGRAEVLREARLMARIDHPNVLKVYGALEDQQRIAFAVELIEGETLEAWFARHEPLGPHALVAIGLELCAALCALHQAQILHGDLKPSNILRHPNGRWIVADFGSGQHTADPGWASGTPRYMAPELLERGQGSPASDQYALAVVLFRLATRRYPYAGDTLDAVAEMQRRGVRERLLDLRPDLPRALVEAIEQGLERDPKQRHASVGAMAAALSAVIAEPLEGSRRGRRGWMLAALTFAVIVAASRLVSTVPVAEDHLAWIARHAGDSRELALGDPIGADEGLTLELELQQPRYLYVINQDRQGARFQLFPLQAGKLRNPLSPGRYQLPGEVDGAIADWRVTSPGGREYFLVILADRPIQELAELRLSEAGAMPQNWLAAEDRVRGVGGTRPRSAEEDPDWQWVEQLKQSYPQARFERFELANP